jgi:hypothetical protein
VARQNAVLSDRIFGSEFGDELVCEKTEKAVRGPVRTCRQ